MYIIKLYTYRILPVSKSVSKIIFINLVFAFIGIEFLSRFYYYYSFKIKEPLLINSYPEIRKYLKYVNHYRDKNFRDTFLKSELESNNKLKPTNTQEDSFFIYSRFASCINQTNCKTVLLQGDSVGEGIGNHASDILFSKVSQNGWQVLHGGTTSFSPKNFSGQLAYFNSKGIKPDVLITYIDQGDLGDDAIRYKNNTLFKNEPFRHYVVKPFKNNHLRFYNYGDALDPVSPYRIKPLAFKFINKIYTLFMVKLFYRSNGKFDLTSTPGWTEITKPLITKDIKKEEYFKEVLENYILSAKDLGVKELYFVTMPHPRNIVDSVSENRKFKYTIATLVEDVVKMNNEIDNLKSYHIPILIDQKLFPCKGKDETCNGFYIYNDHHPEIKGYKYIGKKIINFINKNTEIKDFK